MLKKILRSFPAVVWISCAGGGAAPAAEAPFRPPAVPLVACDPYLSIWSEADHLTDDVTRHWTHRPHSLISLIRVDGSLSRLMGNEPATVPALPQTGLEVTPTRTIYQFEDARVRVTLTFMTPALPDDLEVLSRPVTYLTWSARSADGAAHEVSIYASASSELAVNTMDEKVVWAREKAGNLAGNLTLLRVGTEQQPVLGSSGDDHRINWGYACAAARTKQDKATAALGGNGPLLQAFVRDGELPGQDDTRMPRPVTEDQPVMAFVFHLGQVDAKAASCQVLLAYDEVYSIKYFGKNLQPYWRRTGGAYCRFPPPACPRRRRPGWERAGKCPDHAARWKTSSATRPRN